MMTMGSGKIEDRITLNLAGEGEKREFLSRFMSFKSELSDKGIVPRNRWSDEQLSHLWNDRGSNYILWIRHGGRKVGLAVISVTGNGSAALCCLYIFREDRGNGLGRAALEAIADLARYRGASTLILDVDRAPSDVLEFFEKAGFSRENGSIYRSL